MSLKIISVVGARPQFIKYAALTDEISKCSKDVLIHTGQHYDTSLSSIFFEELHLRNPDYNLGVGSGSHSYQTGEMLKKMEPILLKEKPDFVFVYGDTNSTLAGALAAAKLNIPIAHIEAGLREFDRRIPEEINKIVVDHISTILFTPSKTGVNNLKNEGITNNVHFVGDITFDLVKKIAANKALNSGVLKRYGIQPKDFYYFTIHRQKNTDDITRLKNILDFLAEFQEKPIIFPVHPRTKNYILKYNYGMKLQQNPFLRMIEPIRYTESIIFVKNAIQTITDSGGIIKESYFLKTPSIIIDDTTEWVETVDDGWSHIVGADKKRIFQELHKKRKPLCHRIVYGNGHSGHKIMTIINRWFNERL